MFLTQFSVIPFFNSSRYLNSVYLPWTQSDHISDSDFHLSVTQILVLITQLLILIRFSIILFWVPTYWKGNGQTESVTDSLKPSLIYFFKWDRCLCILYSYCFFKWDRCLCILYSYCLHDKDGSVFYLSNFIVKKG